jgi:ribosomal protein L11 methyltransferase
LNFYNATVLDYGCGTGILGILASKMGAKQVFAVDIEEQAWLNTVENCEVNGVNNINAVCGNLEAVPEKTYDVVLANINRNVILDSLHSLSKLIKTGSTLIFSGFMPNDETVMREGLEQFDIQTVEVRQRNNWMAFKCTVL